MNILKFLSDSKYANYLKDLDDSCFVGKNFNESVSLYLELFATQLYREDYADIVLKINKRFSKTKRIPYIEIPLIEEDPETGERTALYISDISQDNDIENINAGIVKKLLGYVHVAAEEMIQLIYPMPMYKETREPNGKNTFPDHLIKQPDGHYTRVETKTVLCFLNEKGEIVAKVNNAMAPIGTVLKEIRLNAIESENNVLNVITIFYFYFINIVQKEAVIFKVFAIPSALTIDCEYNSDGTFKKLGQKSLTNENTVLNLKNRSPFNKYNTIFDRFLLIKTGKTSKGLDHMISNDQGDYMNTKEMFDICYNQIESSISPGNCIESLSILLDKLILLMSYKYNIFKSCSEENKDERKKKIKHVRELIGTYKKYVKNLNKVNRKYK